MVDEKKLLRRMEAAFKGCGYRVGVVESEENPWLMIASSAWMVRLPLWEASNTLKSLVVKHTGELPGKPVQVQKDSGVQETMQGVLEQDARTLFHPAESMEACYRTKLSVRGYEVWQNEAGACCLFASELTRLLKETAESPLTMVMGEHRLLLDSGNDAVTIVGITSGTAESAMLEHLGKWDFEETEGGDAE